MYNFKKFEKTNQKTESRITVTASNSFGLPTKFFTDNQIASFKYVVLFYDEQQKAVGLHFTNDDEEKHKFTILKSKRGFGGSIIAMSFFKTNNLDADKYHGRYEWEKYPQEGVGELFVIKLKERNKQDT